MPNPNQTTIKLTLTHGDRYAEGIQYYFAPEWHMKLVCANDIVITVNKNYFQLRADSHNIGVLFSWLSDPYLHLSNDPELIYATIIKELENVTIGEK